MGGGVSMCKNVAIMWHSEEQKHRLRVLSNWQQNVDTHLKDINYKCMLKYNTANISLLVDI